MSRSRSRTRDRSSSPEPKSNYAYELSDQQKQWIGATVKSPWFYAGVFAVLTWFHEDSPMATATSVALLFGMYIAIYTVTWNTRLSVAKVIAYVIAFYVAGFVFTFIKLYYDIRFMGMFKVDLVVCKSDVTCYYTWISNNRWYFYKYASTWPMAALKILLKDPLTILKNVLFESCKRMYVWIIVHALD